MKKNIILYVVLLLIMSCTKDKDKTVENKKSEEKEILTSLPFTTIELDDLSAFNPTATNWKIVGNIVADRNKGKTINAEAGTGILFNANDLKERKDNKHLITAFEHSDIELEFDVMMPVRSNSGIYFQGRYEIQLFDSWGVEEPKYSDIGGIYQRWKKGKLKKDEERGYEGHSPKINAAKAPGLWQHFKIKFHAPKFDASGKKIKNAWFEEVWLNGYLIHKNVKLNGPTRGAAFEDEAPRGPIVIQGDHGPVALKNIKYKLYEGRKFKLNNLSLKEYKSVTRTIDLDSAPLIKEEATKVFSIVNIADQKAKKLTVYTADISIPLTGDYLFEVTSQSSAQILFGDKVIDLNDNVNLDKHTIGPVYKTLNLEKGTVPFKAIFNQHYPSRQKFSIYVEGPEMAKYSLQKERKKGNNNEDLLKGIIVQPKDTPVLQRSFIKHNDKKHTHCISVGTPQDVHYTYDLAAGSLLKVWSGDFLNTSDMWSSRGIEQLGKPIGFGISLHGGLEFAKLDSEDAVWPIPLPENKSVRQLGYELDASRMPTFSYQIDDATITNKFTVSGEKRNRQLNKTITVSSNDSIWHKLAEGESIKALSDGLYIINNESYYIDVSDSTGLKFTIRNNNGKDELLVNVPKGTQTIKYSIIW